MKNYKDLLSELPSKTVVFTCGRFNPPNLGHELYVKVVRKLANQRKADHFVFVSSANDAKKNPLDISKKMQYLGNLFPNTRFVQKEIDAIGSILKKYKNVIQIIAWIVSSLCYNIIILYPYISTYCFRGGCFWVCVVCGG